MKIGYARVSTNNQNLATQLALLNKGGIENIFEKKILVTTLKRLQIH